MSRGFTSIIWIWNFDGEKGRVECIYSLGNALEALALSQLQQEECIADCVYCELYLSFFSAYARFLKEVLFHAPLDLQDSLSQISQSFDDLDESEKECFNRDILKGVGWNQIRNISQRALLQMEWEELISCHDDLYTNCL
jgi:hypothetical protein